MNSHHHTVGTRVRMKTRHPHVASAVAVLVAAVLGSLVLTACGSGGSDDTHQADGEAKDFNSADVTFCPAVRNSLRGRAGSGGRAP